MGAPKLDLESLSLADLMDYYEANRPCCAGCGKRMMTLMGGWQCWPCDHVYPFPVKPDWSKMPAYDDIDDAADDWVRPRGAIGGRWVADLNGEWQDEVARLNGDDTGGRWNPAR